MQPTDVLQISFLMVREKIIVNRMYRSKGRTGADQVTPCIYIDEMKPCSHFGPRVDPRGSLVIALARWSVSWSVQGRL